MKPAPIQANGDARQMPMYPIRLGRIITETTLSINSVILLIIGIEPEPNPWLPDL